MGRLLEEVPPSRGEAGDEGKLGQSLGQLLDAVGQYSQDRLALDLGTAGAEALTKDQNAEYRADSQASKYRDAKHADRRQQSREPSRPGPMLA